MSSYKTPENPFSALSESLAEEDGQARRGLSSKLSAKGRKLRYGQLHRQMTVIALIVATAIQVQQKAIAPQADKSDGNSPTVDGDRDTYRGCRVKISLTR